MYRLCWRNRQSLWRVHDVHHCFWWALLVGSLIGLLQFGPLCFALLAAEFWEAHEKFVDFLPLLRIFCLELCNEIRLRTWLIQVGFEHLKESFFFPLALALSVNRHVLFIGLLVIVVLQGDLVSTDFHLAVLPYGQIQGFSAEQVRVLNGIELHDRHEKSKNVD